LTLFVAIALAARDVYCAVLFQRIDIFEAIFWSLLPIVLGTVAYECYTRRLKLMNRHWNLILATNATTAGVFILLFFALRLADPVLVTLAFSCTAWLSMHWLQKRALATLTFTERVVVVSLCILSAATVLIASVGSYGDSGLLGLAMASVSGVVSSLGVLAERRLGGYGICATTILAFRFVLLLLISVLFVSTSSNVTLHIDSETIFFVYPFLFVTIALPSWLGQVAVVNTHPLTFKAIFALVPSFVFALHFFKNGPRHSSSIVLLVAAYTAVALIGNYVQYSSDHTSQA